MVEYNRAAQAYDTSGAGVAVAVDNAAAADNDDHGCKKIRPCSDGRRALIYDCVKARTIKSISMCHSGPDRRSRSHGYVPCKKHKR